ncbi:MAG: hypothetical protein U0W24_11130 [Bacteroidales bacterium]
MKSNFILVVIFIFYQAGMTNAQTEKGKVFLGLSSALSVAGTGPDLISFGFSKNIEKSDAQDNEEDPVKMSAFNLLPKIGIFVANDFLVGIDLTMAFTKSKRVSTEFDYESIDKNKVYCAGPFIRYYFPAKKVRPYFEVLSSFGSSIYKSEFSSANYSDSETSKSSIVTWGGGIGIAAPLGERVTFDVLAGYTSITVKEKDDNPDNTRDIAKTFGLKFGFSIFLGKAKTQE